MGSNEYVLRLRAEGLDAVQRARELMAKQASGVATLTSVELDEYTALVAKAQRNSKLIDGELANQRAMDDLDPQTARAWKASIGMGEPVRGSALGEYGQPRYGAPLGREQTFSELAGTNKRATDFGGWLRALTLGEIESRATMVEGTPATAGNLVPVQYGAPLLDLARNKMQVNAAGARIIPMDEQILKLPRHDQDPVAAWRNELGAISETGVSTSMLTLTARSLACMVRCSWELVEDAPNFEQYISDTLAQAFALKLDATAILGSGAAPEPHGIIGTSGVTVTHLNAQANGQSLAALTHYNDWISLVARLRTKNVEPSAILMAPRTRGDLAKVIASANGQYQDFPSEYVNVPLLETGQIPINVTLGTSNDTSYAIAGDYSSLLIGVRSEFGIRVLRELYAATGEVAFVGVLRSDVCVSRPEKFEVLDGIRP